MDKIVLSSYVNSFKTMLIEQEKRPKTVEHYVHILDKFTDHLVAYDVVEKISIIDYKNKLMQEYSPRTVNNYLLIINKFLVYLNKADCKVSYLKLQKKASLIEILEPIEFKRLLRTAQNMNLDYMYMIMKILAFTGIRIEELKFFTYENIQSNYIEVTNKAKTRNIILRNDLRRELLSYCRSHGIEEGYIFKSPKKNGCMIHTTTIFKKMKKIASNTPGVKKSKVHPHSFRHLFAITFINQGGDISELADILGHSALDTTAIYTRSTDQMKKRKIEQLKY